jgi:hypothetical protein
VPTLELLALILALPGSLTALKELLALRTPARPKPTREPGSMPQPRTAELAITLRLRLRRM